MFLSPDEIEHLTGYKRKAGQREQLAHMGIHFYVNKLGRPIVLREALVNVGPQGFNAGAMPDIEALRELDHGTQTTH